MKRRQGMLALSLAHVHLAGSRWRPPCLSWPAAPCFRRRVAHLTAHSRALSEDFAMATRFTPFTPGFAAECTGVDIGRPLTPQEAAVIDGGMDRYAVLVFR